MPDTIPFNDTHFIENRIFTIRSVPVMLDSDLAQLYEVETKVFNQSVIRNRDRFPDFFAFQLTKEEWENLRSQFVTSSKKHGGRRYLPLVFTEQGVAMLSAILKSNKAIHISIQIIQAFVLMRKTGMQLDGFKQRLALVERKQISHEAKFEQVFKALESADHIPNQGIFFNGQIFDAYKFAADIIKKAKQSIILIDNNIDESTLALLSKRDNHVKAMIYSEKMNLTLKNDLAKLAEQYPTIEFRILKNNHDRFIIIDQKEMYHLGDSLKDLGKKMFAFSRMDAETKLLLSVLDKS